MIAAGMYALICYLEQFGRDLKGVMSLTLESLISLKVLGPLWPQTGLNVLIPSLH